MDKTTCRLPFALCSRPCLSVPNSPEIGDEQVEVSEPKARRRIDGPMSDVKENAIRSAIVVFGALAFGNLSFQIGFKPFLENA